MAASGKSGEPTTADWSPAAQIARARWALAHNTISVHYQPQVRLGDGRLIGLEALLRWRSEDGELWGPVLLAHAFTRRALASRIGAVVRTQALRQLSAWQAAGLEVVPLAINVPPVEMARPGFAEDFLGALRRESIDSGLIELEITEQALPADGLAACVAAVNLLRSAGVAVAIDDFGSGHSGVARLMDLRVDTIKIDRSIIARLAEERRSESVIAAILGLAKDLGSRVIAEGIEEIVQRQALERLGCEYGQGYLTGGPLDADAAGLLLTSHTDAAMYDDTRARPHLEESDV